MTVRKGEVLAENSKFDIFSQFRSKLAITHTIAITWKEKYDAVVVHCSLRLCGDRMKMCLPKKKIFWGGETSTSPWVPYRSKFQPLGRLFRPSRP